MAPDEVDPTLPDPTGRASVDLVEAIRVQAEEHPLIDDKAPETLSEKCLHLMHLKAYDEANKYTAGRDVLDVGCNTGYGTVRLAGAARSVTGVDVSPGAIEAAQARAGGEGVEFRIIDGLGLPFPDHSFDLVTSFQVVEHVADPGPYLREIQRVLRPGGLALFTTPNAAICLDEGMPPWNRFHAREYRAADLRDALGEVFSTVDVFGMFGVPTLYGLEIERVGANRRGVRGRQEAIAANAAAAEAKAEAARARAAAAEAKAAAPVPTPASPPSVIRRARRRFGRSAVGSQLLRVLGRTPTRPTWPGTPPVPVTPLPAPVPATPSTQVVETADPAATDFRVFAVEDLFYSRRDLDSSMDLLALCTVRD